jgi:hypothetical protein
MDQGFSLAYFGGKPGMNIQAEIKRFKVTREALICI